VLAHRTKKLLTREKKTKVRTTMCRNSLQSDRNLRGPHVARQQQLSVDIYCSRPTPAANQPAAAAAVDRRDRQTDFLLCPRRRGTLSDAAIRPSDRLSVPWRSCPRRAAALGYRHAGCLQLSHVWIADPSADGRRSAASRTAIGGGHIVSPPPMR